MSKIFVQYYQHAVVDEHAGGAYGSWRMEYDSGIDGVVTSRVHRYHLEEFTVAPTLTAGMTAYVLWMTYSDGDSFGHSTGEIEVIWVFASREVAEAARARVLETLEVRGRSLTFDDDDGDPRCISNPCDCYFGHYNSVEITECIVDQCPESHYSEEDM